MLTRKHDRFSICFDPVSVSFLGEMQGMGKLYDISYGVKWKAGPGHLLGHPSRYDSGSLRQNSR